MTIADIKKTAETKMDQSITAFKNNLQKIRTGRANPALLDTVQVEYYGSLVPLSQVANVALIDSRTICLLYTSPSPRDRQKSRMPSSA